MRRLLTPGTRYMLGAALGFALMGALVKLVGRRIPSQEIVLARAVVSVFLSYSFVRRAGVPVLGTQRGLLLLRGTFGTCGLMMLFYAFTRLPYAEATVLQYTHPVFTTIFAAMVLGEAIGAGLMMSIGTSLVGVMLVTKPQALLGLMGSVGGELDGLAAAAALGAAVCSASAYVTVRHLSRTENPHVIVLYFPLVAVPATLPFVLANPVWPTPFEWLCLAGIGVLTQVAQICLTQGLSLEPAGRAMSLAYGQIVFAAVLGAMFFGEIPDLWTAAGTILIVGGTLIAARSSARARAIE